MRTEAARRAPTTRPPWLVPLACLLATGALLGLSTNLAELASTADLSPLAFLAHSILGATPIGGGIALLTFGRR